MNINQSDLNKLTEEQLKELIINALVVKNNCQHNIDCFMQALIQKIQENQPKEETVNLPTLKKINLPQLRKTVVGNKMTIE
jgi:hypothetical protein